MWFVCHVYKSDRILNPSTHRTCASQTQAEDRRRTLLRFEEALQALLKPQVASAMNKEAVGALQVNVHMHKSLSLLSVATMPVVQ